MKIYQQAGIANYLRFIACMQANKKIKTSHRLSQMLYNSKIIIDWYFVDKSGKNGSQWEKSVNRESILYS
jgi:hypothetical protein